MDETLSHDYGVALDLKLFQIVFEAIHAFLAAH